MAILEKCGINSSQCSVPWILDDLQLDWVDHIITVETWLEQYVGVKGQAWEWCEHTSCRCVVFREAKHSTLFALRWN